MEVPMTAKTLGAIAEAVGARLIGDSAIEVCDALPLQDARPNCLTMVDAASKLERLLASPAGAVLTAEPLHGCPLPQLIADDLHGVFTQIVNLLRPPKPALAPSAQISPAASIAGTASLGQGTSVAAGAVIGEGCQIGAGCRIGARVVIEDHCVIGDGSVLYPGVVLYAQTRVGNRVTIHANAVLGAHGFGYQLQDGQHQLRAQLGWTEVGDDVEIGANTTIDRGSYGATKIGRGTKIDNLVQIGHNCHVGQHNLICSQVGLAGSVVTGDYVVMAGQVGVKDHVHLADRATVGAKAGVMRDVPAGQTYLGIPATDAKRQFQLMSNFGKLPEMRRSLKLLEQELQSLHESIASASPPDERNVA